eukprot:1194463-Prorocentrum_minimum.AAC.3
MQGCCITSIRLVYARARHGTLYSIRLVYARARHGTLYSIRKRIDGRIESSMSATSPGSRGWCTLREMRAALDSV